MQAGIPADEIKKDPVQEAELEDHLTEAEKEVPEKEHEPWGFVVSVTRGDHHRKLHHVGYCRLISGIHCRDFGVFGDKPPGEREVDSRCGWCFPESEAKRAVEDELE